MEEGAADIDSVPMTNTDTAPSAPVAIDSIVADSIVADTFILPPLYRTLNEAKNIDEIQKAVLVLPNKSIVNQAVLKFVEKHKNIKDIKKLLVRACAETDDVNLITYLEERGAVLCSAALGTAVEKGNISIAKYLLGRGVNCDGVLQFAAQWGRMNVIKTLAELGADVTNQDKALQIAASYGNLYIVKFFAVKGTNPRSGNDQALINAAENGHLDVIEYLVSKGANILAQSNRAMELARKNGYKNVVAYLKANGAKEDKCTVM
jgi:hypothetical protein